MGEEDEYACVTKSKLKIKTDSGIKKKKKKKSPKILINLPMDFFFSEKQRILQKAEMTHKQRVEKFNQHLDSLTEHFDIPKVSWTK
ncbi:hypothetical protein MSG28_009202 [Choristoneura fumiferana]|uniref:Uncharacterized protein n=1 Tax=Choristoneura fumiferana TaxID=7141 RepID=A0ACC0KX53_CHOFU|nr:hypothetical protein MSG28_009202 [Choristoneura fumiferana]